MNSAQDSTKGMNDSIQVCVQNTVPDKEVPPECSIEQWVKEALVGECQQAEVTVRIVDKDESAQLNEQYRHKEGPTNVLSFPFEVPSHVESSELGDLVVCAPVVAEQAKQQHKETIAHWAHMIVHGTLHLSGYDHDDEKSAGIMEKHETEILARLGYEDPYVSRS